RCSPGISSRRQSAPVRELAPDQKSDEACIPPIYQKAGVRPGLGQWVVKREWGRTDGSRRVGISASSERARPLVVCNVQYSCRGRDDHSSESPSTTPTVV